MTNQGKSPEGRATVDLGEIEKRLNERMANESFRKEFFSDPVGVLKREGLVIPPEKEAVLKQFVSSVKIPEEALPGGALAKKINFGFLISIRIDF